MDKKFTVADIFTHEKLTDTTYIVKESYSWLHRFPIGVVVGSERAFVIDSGLGCGGSLREYIEDNITDKPLVCIVTHGHPDHAACAIEFDERYLNEADWPILDEMLDQKQRIDDLEPFALGDQEIMEYGKRMVNDCTGVTFKNVKDGDVFDAGGVSLQVIAMPGHSKGQIALYNKAEKVAFVSDSILKRTHFNSATMEELRSYIGVLQNFIEKVDPETKLIIGHEQSYVGNFKDWPGVQLAVDLKAAIEEVCAHHTEGDEVREDFFKQEASKKAQTYTHTHGCASVIYSESIFE